MSTLPSKRLLAEELAGEALELPWVAEPAGPVALASWAPSRGLLYPSTDDRGASRIYSGRVYLPGLRRVSRAVPLVLFVHATQGKWDQVPQFNRGPEAFGGALAATLGRFAVAMPDLPGYGRDPSPRPHPFCHGRSLAPAVLDLVQPALGLLEQARVPWDGRLFILGYSAGGYAAMAAVREWHDNPRYQHLPLTAAACMAGPFQLSESIRGCFLRDHPFDHPDVLAMLVTAYHDLYPGVASLDPRRALSPRLLEQRPAGFDRGNVLEWVGGSFSTRMISQKINQRLTGSPRQSPRIREVMDLGWVAREIGAKAWPDTEVGRHLRENDLVGGWCPRVPMLLATSPTDDCVDPGNTRAILADWQSQGCRAPVTVRSLTVCGRALGHLAGAVPALVMGFRWFQDQGRPRN
jgi:pimeloyl-ACP methyl ester carboxylesterase